MAEVTVAVKRLENGAGLPLPSYATTDSAGADLYAAIEGKVKIKPRARALIPTGLAIQLPTGYEAQIRPRSGLAVNNGITLLNSPGTIDADFRGEIGVIIINFGDEPFSIERGMRIAQMIIAPVTTAIWQEVSELNDSSRGKRGFGSTGTIAND